jgi:molecular chaperone GrpE
MGTQESTEGAAREEPTAPNHGQEDSTVGGEAPDAPPTKVQELEERADRLMANWQRAQADLANYRKQVEREQLELVKLTTEGLTADTLSVLDDFERAFTTIPQNLQLLTWIEGVWLVYKKLEAILNARGLTAIEAEAAQSFDANLHQALSEVEGDTGTIVEVIQKGYTMGGRLLRPVLVSVGKGSATTEEQTAGKDSSDGPPSDESTSEAKD